MPEAMTLPKELKNSEKLPLELAVFGSENAIRAQNAGVQRVELNTRGSYKAGGLTPETLELQACKPIVKLPIRIMIRPRGAPHKCGELDFIYKPAEKEKMKQSIQSFKDLDIMNPITGDGFVFGALKLSKDAEVSDDPTAGYSVDKEFCQELVQLAKPFPCIFHRAFDQIAYSSNAHIRRGLRDLAACGFKGVLTSGGLGGSYWQHFEKLDAIRCAMDRDDDMDKLQLIVGGGLRADNTSLAVQHLGMHNQSNELWLHSAALKKPTGNEGSDYQKPQTDSSTGNEGSPATDSDWQRRKEADKKAQKAAKEAKLALLAKREYSESDVQGVEYVDNDIDLKELAELLSGIATSKPT